MFYVGNLLLFTPNGSYLSDSRMALRLRHICMIFIKRGFFK